MPDVEKNETREHYLARCVPAAMSEGKTNAQAVGQCNGMFDEHWKQHKLNASREDALIFPESEGGFRPVLMLGTEFPYPKDRNGKPCHYFWKESLKPESFQDIKGRKWEVTPQTIDTIIGSFKLAKDKARFEPPLPASHYDAKGKNYGFIVDARKSDTGSLELLHQFIGDEEKNEALNKKSSVSVLFDQTDAYGNHYDAILDHNAILPNPVLTDLDDFKPALAASRDKPVRAVLLLSRKPEDTMAATPEQVDYVKRECFGGGGNADHVDKDNAMDMLMSHHKALKQTHHSFMHLSKEQRDKLALAPAELVGLKLSKEDVEKMAPRPDPAIADLTGKLTAANGELAKANAKVLELSKAPNPIHPELLIERRLRLVERKPKLVERLGAAHADKLIEKVLGSETAPNALMLSRENDARDCRAAELIDIIIDAPAVPAPGSKTPAQVLPRIDPASAATLLQASKEQPAEQPNELIEKAKAMGVALIAPAN